MIRWLLLGYGDLAEKRVAAALQKARNSELVAVWGRNSKRAADFAKRHNIRESLSGEETLKNVLSRDDIDAVYVCTPVYTHFEYSSLALKSGKHVLCEKPLGMNKAECQILRKMADEKGAKLGVAYYKRCHPKHRYIREMIREGELGEGVFVSVEHYGWFCPQHDDAKYWRVVPEKSGGGVAYDVGSHRLDLLSYWFDAIEVCYAEASNRVHDYPAEDTAMFWLKLEQFNKSNAIVCVSWAAGTSIDRLEILGSKARIIANPLDSKELIITRGAETEIKEFDWSENVHLPLIEDFIDAIVNGKEPICSGTEIEKVNAILEKLNRKKE